MNRIIEYKCPHCGAIIEFDSQSQSMKCPFCSSEYNIAQFRDFDKNLQWTDSEDFAEYYCESCGAQIITDSTTAATHCPYCDNPIILTNRLSGELKPEYVIPFQYDKAAAKEALANHFKGKKLLPKVFSTENHLDEIKGIYVPFWLFDTNIKVDADYTMKNIRVWTDTRNQYTETSIYAAKRNGSMSFHKVPVDGSKKMSDEMMESLEPYDYAQLTEFQTAYLSGYFADKYDVPSSDCVKRVQDRALSSAARELDNTVTGYGSVTRTSISSRLVDTHITYALLPVWILNTSWNGQSYPFAMNGQTGKFVGNLPIDKGILARTWLLYSALFGGIAYAVLSLLHFF